VGSVIDKPPGQASRKKKAKISATFASFRGGGT
jgi:hypothetical protein